MGPGDRRFADEKNKKVARGMSVRDPTVAIHRILIKQNSLPSISQLFGLGAVGHHSALFILPCIYLIAAGPALLVPMLDVELERRNFRWGYWPVLSPGYSRVTASSSSKAHGLYGAEIFVWGISGLVAGAVCSWLSGEPDRRL